MRTMKKLPIGIDEKDYTARLLEDGMETIHRYGVACWKKGCRIMSGADPSVQGA